MPFVVGSPGSAMPSIATSCLIDCDVLHALVFFKTWNTLPFLIVFYVSHLLSDSKAVDQHRCDALGFNHAFAGVIKWKLLCVVCGAKFSAAEGVWQLANEAQQLSLDASKLHVSCRFCSWPAFVNS